MNPSIVPNFIVTSEGNDTTTSVRITQIQNGFILRTGDKPIHYDTIEQVAQAVSAGLLAIDWKESKKESKRK
jgi:hypothetical protein